MGAPLGNTNGKKQRLYEQAVIRALKQKDLEAGDGETLRAIAESALAKALTGDVQALNHLRDTLDGKPAQTIAGDADNPLVQKIIHESK